MSLDLTDQEKYKTLYIQTAKQYIQQLEESTASFIKGNSNGDTLELAHRAAHSLAGQSAVMGYRSIGGLAALLEKIFKAKLDMLLEFNQEILIMLQTAVTRLAESVAAIENNNAELDLSKEKEELSTFTQVTM